MGLGAVYTGFEDVLAEVLLEPPATCQEPPAMLRAANTGGAAGAGAKEDCDWLLPPGNTAQGGALTFSPLTVARATAPPPTQ